jgi:hypothetical protein
MIATILQEKKVPVHASTPAISIVMPFDPKVTPRDQLERNLQEVVSEVSTEMETRYSREYAYPFLSVLRKLVAGLNYSTYKRSIAIFISASTSKLYYMDMPVDRHISIDRCFNMRYLAESRQQVGQFMFMVLSSGYMKVFLGSQGEFIRILSSPFATDASLANEESLDKFMRYADSVLVNLFECYPFPSFVLASEETAAHFKRLTTNARHIVGYIDGNFEDATEHFLHEAVLPHIENWDDIRQTHLLNQLANAQISGKLAMGMRAVYRKVSARKGQLLVVEKNYTLPLKAFSTQASRERPPYIGDAVDVVIEKVLENGGDVEFVNEGMLLPYRKIALITY